MGVVGAPVAVVHIVVPVAVTSCTFTPKIITPVVIAPKVVASIHVPLVIVTPAMLPPVVRGGPTVVSSLVGRHMPRFVAWLLACWSHVASAVRSWV
jgi:hypothetical protein